MSSSTLVQQIRTLAQPSDTRELVTHVRRHLDDSFSDIDTLLSQSQPGPSNASASGSGSGTGISAQHPHSRGGPSKRRKRNLDDEIKYWEEKEARAAAELDETSRTLPIALEDAQKRLQSLLSSAQDLSIQRYALADKLANLVSELSAAQTPDSAEDGSLTDGNGRPESGDAGRETVLERMEKLGEELARYEAGLVWAKVLERIVVLSERTLSPTSHKPSPLAALPHYRELNDLVTKLEETLPEHMALLKLVVDIRDRTWAGLKDIMSGNLLTTSEALGWPKKVLYHTVPAAPRRMFEHAFQDLLFLQAEGEALHGESRPTHWSSGKGLYPLQALVQPISLRFKYHFQGTKGTNRVDKPEWAFANILDQIYEHQAFMVDYLQLLTERGGYENVNVKSEFTLLLLPTLLSLLKSRIPRLLDHPALLAHTIYQTVVFDDAIREGGFDYDTVSISEGVENASWEGLTGVILREADWFARWLAGEKKFSDGQLNDIISSPHAWSISDESSESASGLVPGLRPTISARQVKALVEQIIDRYSPLPELEYKLPFLLSLQLPILSAYQARISGSLDAFESLSSAFVRHVPGALAGNTRSGVHIDQAKLTGGQAGLEKLVKAWLSAKWVHEALRKWADDLFFVEMSSNLTNASSLRWKFQSDSILPFGIRSPLAAASDSINGADGTVSVFDILIERFATLVGRIEDMIVRHVTVEVENDLKQHLTRRWDLPPSANAADALEPSPSFLHALTTYTSHLSYLHTTLPSLSTSKLYRRVVNHLSNHISQRAVYSGWSKFSESGGRSFLEEIKEWKDVSKQSLLTGSGSSDGREIFTSGVVDHPWSRLTIYGKILSLPSGTGGPDKDSAGLPTFSEAMAAAWSDGDANANGALKAFLVRVEISANELKKEELQSLLRRRGECWR